MAWVEDVIREGEGYLSGTQAYKRLPENMAVFEGIFKDTTRSTLVSNFLKYNIRKFVETLADIREIGLFGSDAAQYKEAAEIANKVSKCIYTESQYPRQLLKVLKWASVTGIGYMWPKCKAEDYGFGERRIIFEPLGLMDVLPVQVPSTNDVEDAYAVTVYEYMPIAEAHGRFPAYQSELTPINDMTIPTRLSARRLDWAEKFRYGSSSRSWGSLYCEIRYTYVRDLRINTTGVMLPMGEANTSWYYEVPSVGQLIFGGVRNGVPFQRPAQMEDCRVYPNLRLIITSPSVAMPMYDGPAFDWHGKMPIVQFTVDDWPWIPGGLSLVDSVRSLEVTKRKHERLMDQIVAARANPPMGYDRTVAAGPKIENFDLFAPDVRAGMDGVPKDTFQSLLPESVVVTEVNFQFHELLIKEQEQQLGINDLGTIMNAKLNLSSDSFDKALETVGPIAKGIAAAMEAANAKVAYRLKFLEIQYMDTRRIIEYIGPDKITPEMMDFDPLSLVPSHMADEYVNELLPTADVNGQHIPIPSFYDKLRRARIFASNLRLIQVPSTLLKITQQQEQLKYLQLYRGGFPISPQTVAAKLGIENYGEIDGADEFAKWVNWKKLELLLAAQAQQIAGELGLVGPDELTPAPHAGGRPPSGNAPPKIRQKGKNDGNPRTTITESE